MLFLLCIVVCYQYSRVCPKIFQKSKPRQRIFRLMSRGFLLSVRLSFDFENRTQDSVDETGKLKYNNLHGKHRPFIF